MRSRLFAVLGTACCVAALVVAAPAAAKEARPPLAGIGSFAEARGVAVEQATGDVYIIDGRNERQSIKVSATAGNFKLKFNGGERELAFNAGAGAVGTALGELAGVSGVGVGGGPGNATGSSPYEVQFSGALESTDVPQILCEAGAPPLEGGSGCTVTTTVPGINGQIARYHANDTPAPFSGLGTNENVIDARKGPGGKACGEEPASCDVPTPPAAEGLRFSSLAKEAQLAIDESGGATDGDIYVTQALNHLVDVFSPTGAYLGQLTEYEETPGTPATLKPLNEVCGVAVDGSGDVYLGDFSSADLVHKYVPGADPVANTDNVANFNSLAGPSSPCTLAAGAGPTAGFLFVDRFNGELFKLNASTGALLYGGNPITTGATTVTVDPVTGHVLAAVGSEVREYDASGASSATLLHTFAAGSAVNGIAVKGSSSTLYLSRAGISHLDVYGPWTLYPDVHTTGVIGIGGTHATLHGTISAAGGPAATCEFEIVPQAAYLHNKEEAEAKGASPPHELSPPQVADAAFAGAQSAPCVPAGPFTGSNTEAVSAAVTGLAGGTEYRFRLVGENSNGNLGSEGPELFETLGKPLISAIKATPLSDTEASITGKIDPRGLDSQAFAQYVTKAQFEASVFAKATTVPGPAVPKEVKGKGDLSFAAGAGNLTAGSKEVTALTTESGLFEVGQKIEGAGIPANTTIASVEGAALILSEEALATAPAVALKAFSTTVTNLTTEAGRFGAGEAIEGAGIAPSTTVISAGEGELVLSKAPTEYVVGAALTATGPQPVTIAFAGLAPSTEYVARIVASNESGTGEGEEIPFSTLVPFPPPPVFETCGNDSLRAGPGAKLPDCRAYEQVSPVDKLGANVIGNPNFSEAAADGEAAVYSSYQGQPTTGGASHAPAYVASRGPEGWSSDGALPPTEPGLQALELGRDEELETALSIVPEAGEEGSLVATDLVTFSRSKLLSLLHVRNAQPDPQFATDPAHFIFEDTDALLSGAVAKKPNLYDYDHGALSLAGMVPHFPAASCEGASCEPAPGGSFAGSYLATGTGNLEEGGVNSYRQGTISQSGAKVFFTEAGTGRLFMRAGNRTVQLNAPQGGTDPNGRKPAQWLASTPNGAVVFFASCERLTADSTAHSTAADECLSAAQGQDLYEYDTRTGNLRDLTVDSTDTEGAQVQGLLGASSPDGAFVYFVANGVLAAGASAGDCSTSTGFLTGECNLYLRHTGTTTFVARLGANAANVKYADADNWAPAAPAGATYEKTARVATDGTLLFSSTLEVPGYENISADPQASCSSGGGGPGPCAELYRYTPGDPTPTCVSCDPSGAAPLGNATLVSNPKVGEGILQSGLELPILTRNLSADGSRVFFETPDRLVGSDTNGVGGCPQLWRTLRSCQDVYEWEAAGARSETETCHSSAQNGGCLYLISTGTSKEPSFFDDADESGNNAFFFTYSPLVTQDTDTLADLYDARVEGGIAAQQASPPALCGSAEGCRGEPGAAPSSQSAATPSFQGPGNVKPKKPEKHQKKKHHAKKHKHLGKKKQGRDR